MSFGRGAFLTATKLVPVERSSGVLRENAGMSSERGVRILTAEYLVVSRVKLICPGQVGTQGEVERRSRWTTG